MIGTTVAHYRIIDKLGAGGMGEVYLAEDTKLDRKVALKFLPESLLSDPEARERLLREAKATSRLNHPNILTVYSVEQYDGRDYIVMEFVDGRPLDEFTGSREWPLDDLLGFALQIAEGLHKAHQSGIVHRDIKPSNILIDADRRARLLDFGLATYKGATKLTQTGSTLGTAAYMSPEQAMSHECDHRSDLFSLGVVLYEMVTGHLPFRGEHSAALAYAIVNEEPEPLARYKAEAPETLQRIVSKCLAKRPSERYQSAADLVADFRHLHRQSGIPASAATPVHPRRKMLAVLPFENMGPTEDEYFADGITEEIISRLAAVKELGVISRTSVMQYKNARRPIRDIGAELGADHILEGTVRWGKASGGMSRVRITPQLIKVSDDTHLWSDRYDRVLEDIFDVQSDIAEQVIKQLNVTLLAPERAAINVRPTANVEAYNAYLRGKEYLNRPSYLIRNFKLAEEMFNRAVRLDPNFASAWAELSMTHSDMYHHGHDQTDARRKMASQAVEKALALQPNAPDVLLAHALYQYRCLRNYDDALRMFEQVSELAPNNSESLLYTGAVLRRKGDTVRGLECIRNAAALDPLNAHLPAEMATTLLLLRRYEEADVIFQRAIEMAPDQMLAYTFRASNYLAWKGDLKRARACLDDASLNNLEDANVVYFVFRQYLFEGRYAEGLAFLDTREKELYAGQPAIEARSTMRGIYLSLLGRSDEATAAFRKAIKDLSEVLSQNPDDHRAHLALAIAYSGLGDSEKVLAHGQKGKDLCPVSQDALLGSLALYQLAIAYAGIGQYDLACQSLEEMLAQPSWYSRQIIRLDPIFDSLKGNTRFDSLMAQEDTPF